ncbi:phospholipid phosphatase 5 isoform X2 [Neodiprion pinetum]|uniref:phospholipid phosphatase 5 n=1 Tax=Neodiprion fabricii TaxID=2872261 RepID=UPI001ED96BF4|nr:phospholipid phosphatase 5 [Neodiprion fabricii]XP_046487890.1 phospholipid phosphatase 5 isoform X2 [Neodiprion pinetum]XP_046625059.1 phospholipid phosphatase 5 isoform X1 [Neodiprion virginianus]
MPPFRGLEMSSGLLFDILLRGFLGLLFMELERAEPFTRKIHIDELWLYKNPRTDSYVPTTVLWPLVFVFPIIVICLTFLVTRDRIDFYQATLSVTLTLGLNGVITDVIKLIVGRPRPDYYWRCFPDGAMNTEFDCNGDPALVRDGKKSFPSGHSSFAFASLGFISLYLAGKLHTFTLAGKGQAWKLCIFLIPLGIALSIALSRTCDYHHHWQDITVGSTIGILLTYLCYRHYYPPLDSPVCHKPYSALISQIEIDSIKGSKGEQVKWI